MNIKTFRKEKGYTQEQLAQRVGISQSYIAAIESSNITKSPSFKTLSRIADVLDVQVGQLFSEKKNPTLNVEHERLDIPKEIIEKVDEEIRKLEEETGRRLTGDAYFDLFRKYMNRALERE